VFLEELRESGDRDIERIVAIVVKKVVDLLLTPEAFGQLELGKRWASIDRVDERREGAGFGVVDVAPFLEEKRDFVSATGLENAAHQHKRKKERCDAGITNLIVNQTADVGSARVGHGNDLDLFRVLHPCSLQPVSAYWTILRVAGCGR